MAQTVEHFFCLPERDVLICEGGKQLIKCEHQEINIISASYGRTDRDVCQWGLDWTVAWLWNVNCHADKVVDVLRGECQDLSECELHANSAEFGDPCFGTKKYLQVNRQFTIHEFFRLTCSNSNDFFVHFSMFYEFTLIYV